MQIDVHGHIGGHEERRIEPAGLRDYLDASGLDAVLVSNLSAASHGPNAADLEETDANVACLRAQREDERLLPLYWVRPGRFDSNLHAFAGALDSEPFLGALFAPGLNGYRADDELVDRYMTVLAGLHKVAIFETGRADEARPERVYNIARRHPLVPVVLYHAAGDVHWREALDCLERSRQRQDARLYLDTARASVDEIEEAVQIVGDEHVLFGADVDGPEDAARVQEQVEQLRAAFASPAFERIVGMNTVTLFGALVGSCESRSEPRSPALYVAQRCQG